MAARKSSDRPIRVAIVGGGCAAITTAFELTRPEHRGRYAVTVYQQGWRLGGKGASGRGPSGRIEEHGLHVWLGYYDNAFRLLRQCYAELEACAPGRYGGWRDAFLAESDIGLFAPTDAGGWQNWAAHFPPAPGFPGDSAPPGALVSLRHYLARSLSLLRTLILDCAVGRDAAARVPATAEGFVAMFADLARMGVFAGATVLAEALAVLAAAIEAAPIDSAWTSLAEQTFAGVRRWLEDRLIAQDRMRHVWEVIDLSLAYILGTIRFGLLTNPRGLDAIDDYECRDWLRLNGASERALASPFVRGLYDLALAYQDGDPGKPSLSAAQGLRATLRLFYGYRGAIFWRMRAGMGDVVFAPFYELLRRRGVGFEFFHRLTNVGLSSVGEPSHVRSLTFDRQAKVKGGAKYQPLITVAGKPCWPSQPDFSQLVNGVQLAGQAVDFESHWDRTRTDTIKLEVSRDFDFVVLGVSVGAIPHVCPEILARDRRWRLMTRKIKTVATQAFQIWLREDLQQLGWQGPPYIVAGFVKPFDTWCDMAQIVPDEGWRDRPATAVYFCGVLPEPGRNIPRDARYPHVVAERVREQAVAHLNGPAKILWPGICDASGNFRTELLVGSAANADLNSAFESQYWRANVNPSDRYVLSVPGSAAYRISPLDMTYDNLTIAGDWTDCGFNAGCVEAAVMSGRLAAHALCGSPPLEEITGYDHP
ncbi:MAG TPA: FAD-dependent oxidoreductase [Caulobacteraceae bacterium]